MIKNIIFDLDNTIIEYSAEYILPFKEALINLGYGEDDYLKIYNALNDYGTSLSDSNRFYSRESAIEFLNNTLDTHYDIRLIDEVNSVIGKYWIKYILLPEETLKYLASKYNLYVFTNWFESAQAERLKNIGYLKYFVRVCGPDNFGIKPLKSSFEDVLNFIGASPEECVMIGDSKANDIASANNAGIRAILFDYDGARDKKDILASDYTVISDLKELEKIL